MSLFIFLDYFHWLRAVSTIVIFSFLNRISNQYCPTYEIVYALCCHKQHQSNQFVFVFPFNITKMFLFSLANNT